MGGERSDAARPAAAARGLRRPPCTPRSRIDALPFPPSGKKKAAAPPLPAAQRARIDKMFSAAAPRAATAPARAPVDPGATDAVLDDILGGLGGEEEPAPRARRAAPPRAAVRAAPSRAAARLAAAEAAMAAVDETDAAAAAVEPAAEPEPVADAAPAPAAKAEARTPRPAPRAAPAVATAMDEDAVADGALAAGWEDLVGGGAGGAGGAGDAAPALLASQPAAVGESDPLPTSPDGTLPFFLIDAHEEPGDRGSLYLFGKVPLDPCAPPTPSSRYASACAVLTGLPRAVFFVPRPSVFGPAAADLARLEADAAANPAARGALMAALHEAAADLKAEVMAVLAGAGVAGFSLKPVKRAYPGVGAPPGVPLAKGDQWVLKARLPAGAPFLPAGVAGEHFAAAFGGNQSTLEAFLLKRRVKGSTWLSLAGATRIPDGRRVSWCALEVTLAGWKGVTPADGDGRDPPPLVVAAVKVTTALHPQAKTNEVVALSVVTLPALPVHRPAARAEWATPAAGLSAFTIVRKLDGRPFPPGFDAAVSRASTGALAGAGGGPALAGLPTEKALLGAALARLKQVDADVLVGHNAAAFDLDVLLHRSLALKVPHWSRLGRLKRTKPPRGGGGAGGAPGGGGASFALMSAMAGRLLCDTYLQARDTVKEVDYTLGTMARVLLGQARSDLPQSAVRTAFDSADGLLALARHAQGDAWLSLGVAAHLNALPLTRALACLSGSLWSRALLGQRAGRIEMLLLHELHARKMLLPDRWSQKDRERLEAAAAAKAGGGEGGAGPATSSSSKKKGPQYAGGLVLEPKKGLYDCFVLLLDFNSLYPSIIQEYDICFTTVTVPADGGPAPLPPPSDAPAVLPTVIRGLVERRRAVKGMLKAERDPTRRAQLDIRQHALKLTANSMYGCLGFSSSRFHARPLAELVTSTGREVLQATVDAVTNGLGADVIYGDTDSIMVATGAADLEGALALAAAVKRDVNKKYRALEIELDGVYSRMLLLKKKKYAALKLEPGAPPGPDGAPATSREAKGLDIVRRDWCPLAKDVGNKALDAILGGGAKDDVVAAIHDALRDVAARVAAGAVPLHKFVVTKALTKRPQDYPDASNQPHVQVALRRGAAGAADAARAGETVPYVICVDGPSAVAGDASSLVGKPLAARAFHPDEVRASNGVIAPDAEYYLGHQVHPVVSRLAAPIEGTNPGAMAECLGLDPARYGKGGGGGGSGAADLAAAARDAALLGGGAWLDDDARFADCPAFKLPGAGRAFAGAEAIAAGEVEPEAALGAVTAAQLANAARLACRAVLRDYYDAGAAADDELARAPTRDVALRSAPGLPPGAAPADPASTARMVRDVSEADAYARLVAVWRALDPERGVAAAERKAAAAAARGGAPPAVAGAADARIDPVRDTLAAGAAAAAELRDAAAFRWVDVGALFAF